MKQNDEKNASTLSEYSDKQIKLYEGIALTFGIVSAIISLISPFPFVLVAFVSFFLAYGYSTELDRRVKTKECVQNNDLKDGKEVIVEEIELDSKIEKASIEDTYIKESHDEIDIKTSSKNKIDTKHKKINWNEKRDEISSNMNPCPLWIEGSYNQQEFADKLVEGFCKRLAKYLCWALKDELIDNIDEFNITNSIFNAISEIDDAKWWCNKKNTPDKQIALKLLNDNDELTTIVKEIYKKYD